jgi:hypothetical protein
MVWNAVIFGPGESLNVVSDHAATVATAADHRAPFLGRMLTLLQRTRHLKMGHSN